MLGPFCEKLWGQKLEYSSVTFGDILRCLINLFLLFAESAFTLTLTANVSQYVVVVIGVRLQLRRIACFCQLPLNVP